MSNISRAAKIQALHEVGAKIDDGLEQAKIQTARRDGTRTGHTEAINQLVSNCKDPALDRNTVQHCIKLIQQLQTQSNALYYMTMGAEKQCAVHVAEIKKMYDLEVALKLREETLPTPEESASRPAPPRTLRETRLAEAALAASSVEEKPEEPQETKEPEVKEPVAPSPETNNNESSLKGSRNKKSAKTPQSETATESVSVTPSKKEVRKKRKVKSSS
jgi:hypothetical protein